MTIFKWTLLFPFFIQILHAQPSILGKAETWKGKEIRLIEVYDPISGAERILDIDTISSEGNFILQSNISKSAVLWMAVNRFKAPIFLEGNSSIEISIVENKNNQLADAWQRGSFEYLINSETGSNLNSRVAAFDEAYYNFYTDNALKIGTSAFRKAIDQFAEAQNIDSASTHYFDLYRKFTIAEMRLSAGENKLNLYRSHLQNGQLHFENPAWLEFFNLFYSDYFSGYDGRFGGASISNRLKIGISADSLYALLTVDPFLEAEPMRQVVMLKSIAEVYENKAYPPQALLKAIDHIVENAVNEEIATMAKNLLDLYGSKAKPLNIAQLELHNFNYQTLAADSLPIIAAVTLPWSLESSKEMALLDVLCEKYPDIFKPLQITIGSSGSAEDGTPLIAPVSDYIFLETMNIYSFPYFFQIDPKGFITSTGIEKPSEGLEERLYKLQAEKREKNRIKVGR